jgi:DNA-binding transcriptional MerR regulator
MSVEHERPIGTAVSPADPLLTIGVFARRSRLSMKALRLYDRLGLLKPADVDPETGYRRYRERQLITARLVVMLRRLDMPLAQVAEIVAVPYPVAVERLTSYWEAFERRVAGQRELVAHIRGKLAGEDGCLQLPSVAFPQIASAYDGVTAWVASQGFAVAGSPRELYFTDFVSAGPADDVCDVALPIE